MPKMLVISADKCTGCRNCELACSLTKEGSFRPMASRVHVNTWEEEGVSVPMMCQHCADAPCIPVCAPHAMQRDGQTGWVQLDQAKCIGCKMCVQACPFGNAVWDSWATKILKCDYCGGDPACAKSRPTQAISWADDLVAVRARKRAFAEKFLQPLT